MLTNIIDNDRKGDLASLLKEEFKGCNRLAIATAYFNIRGFGAIKEGLLLNKSKDVYNANVNGNTEEASNLTRFISNTNNEDANKELRLLLGREPSEEIKWEDKILRELEKEQEENEDNDNYYNLLQECIEYFKNDKREVRMMEGQFFHGKCYIGMNNDDGVIGVVGSSNFTYGGLVSNRELNMYTKDEDTIKELYTWFEEQWKNSRDFKKEFLSALEKYVTAYSPYDIIAKALYETYKDQIDLAAEEKARTLRDMFVHQQISYISAKQKLKEYNGVIIADSTGLGKTKVALNIIHDMQREGKRTILISPKSILDTTWKDEMRKWNINLHPDDIISTEYLSHNPDEVINMLSTNNVNYNNKSNNNNSNNIGLIVVDEAHYFRNPSSNRRKALEEIIARFRPKVVLLTATPINTSLMDLYNLFSLYLPDDCLRDIGIESLRNYFIAQQSRWLEGEEIDMDIVLQKFMVRHSRQFAKTMAIAEGKDIHFPERILNSIEYTINIKYEEIFDKLNRLNFAFYELSVERLSNKFRLPDGRVIQDVVKEKERLDNLKEMVKLIVKINIFKRLESSLSAYNNTLEMLLKYIDIAIRYAQYKGYFIPPKLKGDIFQLYDEEEDDILPDPNEIFNNEELMNICRLSSEEIKEFVKKCKEDIEILQNLKIDIGNRDGKFNQLLDYIKEKYAILKGNNNSSNSNNNGIIIFTQYYDTARYLYDELRKTYSNDVILVSGKGCKNKDGKSISDTEAIDLFQATGGILVTTDKLSAGQNLQNAQYVINYDFPWNPVVLIQRAGRIDRLGSRYENIYLVNVLPSNRNPDDPSSLTHFLSVYEKLYNRLTAINETIGLDASHLGEHATPRDFSIYASIAKNDQSIIGLLEKRMEQFTNEPMDILAQIVDKKGIEYLKSLPNGIGAYKKSDKRGLFVLFSVYINNKRSLEWRLKFYDDNTVLKNARDIIDIIMQGGDVYNKGARIDYSILLKQLKDMKEELKKEIEDNLKKMITADTLPTPSKDVRDIYDSLAKVDEALAAKFRKHANKPYIVNPLKRAKKEGNLIENARKILDNIIDDDSDKTEDTNIRIKRVCWCYIG